MKKVMMILATMSLSSAYAAFPGASFPTEVSIPQLDGGFVLGVTGDYLEPTASDGDVDFISANSSIAASATPYTSRLYQIDPSFQWGWGLDIGYIFPQTANDINLSYSQLNTSDNDTVISASNNLTPINPFFTVGSLEAIGNIDSVYASDEYNFYQADLTFGQLIDVGCRVRLHPKVGLRYTQIQRKLFQNFNGTDPFSATISEAVATDEQSDYTGIGPLAGFDASYYLGMGFGAVAHFDSAILIGNIQSNLNTTFSGPAATTSLLAASEVFPITTETSRRVVPEVDGKLGLDYTYLFNNAANSDLTLEIGYEASKDYNAIDRLPATLSPDTLFVSAAQTIGTRRTSNLGLHGPYAALTLHV